MNVKMLKGVELFEMLSSLSPTERANMLKKRFEGLIAKANPVHHETEVIMIDLEPKLEEKKKIIVNSSSPIISSAGCNHHHQGEVKSDSFINKKRKRGEAKEEQRIFPGGGKKEKKLMMINIISDEEDEKFDLKKRREHEEEEEKQKKIIARKHQIESERKAFRLALLRLEKSAVAAPIFDNNYKVIRDFEKLINARPKPYY